MKFNEQNIIPIEKITFSDIEKRELNSSFLNRLKKKDYKYCLDLCQSLLIDPKTTYMEYVGGEKYSIFERFLIPLPYYTRNNYSLFNCTLNLKLILNEDIKPNEIDFGTMLITDKMIQFKDKIIIEFHNQFYEWEEINKIKFSDYIKTQVFGCDEIKNVYIGNQKDKMYFGRDFFIKFTDLDLFETLTLKLYREAENKIRLENNLPKVGEGWISEMEVLSATKKQFPEYEVIHQANPEFLGLQRIDVFIPELKAGIEYQGEQHYKPIRLFGGKKGLKKTQERDQQKFTLCVENGVKLFYIKYDDNIESKLELIREEILNNLSEV